jgi:hypothetical protein
MDSWDIVEWGKPLQHSARIAGPVARGSAGATQQVRAPIPELQRIRLFGQEDELHPTPGVSASFDFIIQLMRMPSPSRRRKIRMRR